MPTREQIDSVVAEVERLQAEPTDGKPWDALTYSERYVALREIEWAGFSRKEETAVIGRVLIDEPPELWMEGIGRHDDDPLRSPEELRALAEEIRRDEFAARVRDYGEADAATYEARMAEAYRHRALALGLAGSPARPPITDAELERLLGELERGWAEGHGTGDKPPGSRDETDHHNRTGGAGDDTPRREPSAGPDRSPGDGLLPDDEPVGFQVWHRRGEHYEHVAAVGSNALGAIMMTTHGFMGYDRWPDNPAVSAAPGEHRSTDIGDVLIGPDSRSLQIAADDGLHLRPIAPVDQIPSDAKGRPEEPHREVHAKEPPAETEAVTPPDRREAPKAFLVRYETIGTPVHEDELGPNLGYDDIKEGYRIVHDERELEGFDPASYRSVRVLGEIPPACAAAPELLEPADPALRLAVLEARIEGYKHRGEGHDPDPARGHRYCDLPEEERFARIMGDIRELHLEDELAAYHVLGREVDIARAPDPFDRIVADLPRQWRDDGHADGGETWEALNPAEKLAYLAERTAAQHPVSFERLADAAGRTLGLPPGQEITSDQEWHLLERYRAALERQERSRAEPRGLAEGGAVAEPPQQAPDIRVLPGRGNPAYRGERTFDIHDATGKLGHLAGYMGGPWGEDEFRVTHVEIAEPGRRLSPGEWKGVLRGLGELLPDAEYLGANRTGINGDLSPAYEKLVRLPPPEASDRARVDVSTGPHAAGDVRDGIPAAGHSLHDEGPGRHPDGPSYEQQLDAAAASGRDRLKDRNRGPER